MNTGRLLNLPKQLSTLVLLFLVLRTPTDHKFKPTREELKTRVHAPNIKTRMYPTEHWKENRARHSKSIWSP